MSKQHTTIKNIRQNWNKVFYCGYCDLQYIMRYEEPTYYNAGVYGWNCDVYCDFGRDIAITTGYRNMTGKRISEELIEKYSEVAKEICKTPWTTPYETIQNALRENREKFFEELYNM